MTVKVYGIKNCDTMKRTFQWLEEEGIPYQFIDYKKQIPTVELLESFLEKAELEQLINKKGTTYRKLSEGEKESLSNRSNALDLLSANSSMIKRPIVLYPDGDLTVGFEKDAIMAKWNEVN